MRGAEDMHIDAWLGVMMTVGGGGRAGCFRQGW